MVTYRTFYIAATPSLVHNKKYHTEYTSIYDIASDYFYIDFLNRGDLMDYEMNVHRIRRVRRILTL